MLEHKSPVDLTDKIMQVLFRHQRRVTNETTCQHEHYTTCFPHHVEKIDRLIRLGKQLLFILPAFPAKSPNREKTMSPLPDLGERLALRELNQICNEITELYPVGVQLLICSDGRVFNDLVLVKDNEVDAYTAEIKRILDEEKLTNLSMFGLDECYKNLSYIKMRSELITTYGNSLSSIRQNTKEDQEAKLLFNGIHRFMYEDQRKIFADISNNQIREATKILSYKVIQRSNAWSNLIAEKFSDAIRLSIHPQFCGSHKLGVMLLKSKDVWATPWHRVPIQQGNEYVLVRKKEAENMGAQPQYVNNKFSHYLGG